MAFHLFTFIEIEFINFIRYSIFGRAGPKGPERTRSQAGMRGSPQGTQPTDAPGYCTGYGDDLTANRDTVARWILCLRKGHSAGRKPRVGRLMPALIISGLLPR